MMNKKFVASASAVTTMALLATGVLISTPAQARERDFFGQCSAGNPFEFSVDRERRSVDFDFDIERATPFEQWTITITQNGKRVVNERMTSDEDGDTSREYVRRSTSKTKKDNWVMTARSASGNTCKANVRN